MGFAADTMRREQHYRRSAFLAGLQRTGFALARSPAAMPGPADVLLVWNRTSRWEGVCRRYEAAGARVIVAENAYAGDDFSLSLGHHNGRGFWRQGADGRADSLALDMRPWRKSGTHILVLPQRGIGELGVAMPRNWLAGVTTRLRQATGRPIKVRPHPGNDSGAVSLGEDLVDCHAVVTWGSGAAIKAVIAGVPAYYDLSGWIGAGAAKFGVTDIENPFLGDRLPMLRRLAWAQWTIEEIESGEAFRFLLS